MCSGPERNSSKTSSPSTPTCSSPSFSSQQHLANMATNLSVEADDAFASLLELAANDDLDAFQRYAERFPSAVDEPGTWYGPRRALQQRTPLMVASTYGSLRVVNYILSLSAAAADINRSCGSDGFTALHCAASGGSANADEVVGLLLSAGADPDAKDVHGRRPADVIVAPPKLSAIRIVLQELLGATPISNSGGEYYLHVSTESNSPRCIPAPDDDISPSSNDSGKFENLSPVVTTTSEKKEYPIDPSLPDINKSVFATDEFRMFSFKVRPCSRAYSHDWTECPFVHPGENARRRDPRKYHYSCVPCPDFRKGACRRGDLCEYAHGVFECWLHPAQYRTRLCKDGTSCTRRVCFFAHTNEELRPLYMSTGSAVPSPRSSASAVNGHNPLSGWQQPAVPTLHLPGSSLQSSRLRSSLSARDMPVNDLLMFPEFDEQQQLIELCFANSQSRLGSSAGNRLGPGRIRTLAPSDLDDLFSAEISSSPRYNPDQGAVFSPSHKAVVLNQLQQQQQQNLLSPINTSVYSPKAMDPPQSSTLQASLGISSPGRMSPRGVEPMSPLSSRAAALAQREKQQQTLRSFSSRDLGSTFHPKVGSPINAAWPNWGSPCGTPDWGVNSDELGRLRRSNSFELRNNGEEPDVSWVHSLVKESPTEKKKTLAVTSGGSSAARVVADDGRNPNPHGEEDKNAADIITGWLEQMQLDQSVAL